MRRYLQLSTLTCSKKTIKSINFGWSPNICLRKLMLVKHAQIIRTLHFGVNFPEHKSSNPEVTNMIYLFWYQYSNFTLLTCPNYTLSVNIFLIIGAGHPILLTGTVNLTSCIWLVCFNNHLFGVQVMNALPEDRPLPLMFRRPLLCSAHGDYLVSSQNNQLTVLHSW